MWSIYSAIASAAQPLAILIFAPVWRLLPYGPKAAQHYGSIRRALAKQGQPIGVNDLHIAAHARSEGLTLVSNSLRDCLLRA